MTFRNMALLACVRDCLTLHWHMSCYFIFECSSGSWYRTQYLLNRSLTTMNACDSYFLCRSSESHVWSVDGPFVVLTDWFISLAISLLQETQNRFPTVRVSPTTAVPWSLSLFRTISVPNTARAASNAGSIPGQYMWAWWRYFLPRVTSICHCQS
jgi:hypothetical protein